MSVSLGNTKEMLELAYIPDAVQSVVEHMTKFDANFKLPDDFFVS